MRGFWGGDLAGIASRLDYLARLGVEVLYLTPIFASPSNHRYDTVDYLTVDPLLGGNEALHEMVDAAHAAGIRVVLDVSINHVHPRFFAFADLVRNGRRSEFCDWFVIEGWPPRILHRPHVKAHRSLKEWVPVWQKETGLPVEEVADAGRRSGAHLRGVVRGADHAAREPGPSAGPRLHAAGAHRLGADYGVDGWRLDVARYVDPDVWRDLRRVLREVRPDAYLLGEVMGDAGRWLQGDAFDASMNYPLRELALRFFATGAIDGREVADGLARMWARGAWPVTQAAHNLIGSHDTPRFLTLAGGELWRLRLAVVLQMTFPGAPGLYYGDEVGMAAAATPAAAGLSRGRTQGTPATEPATPSAIRCSAPSPSWPRCAARSRPCATASGGRERRERRWSPSSAGAGRRRVVVALNRGRTAAVVELGSTRARLLWGGGTVADGRLRVAGRDAAIVRA